MKKITLFIFIMAFAISCGGNKTSSENSSSANKIRVAYLADFAGTSAAAIAQEKGFFKEENLDVELVKFLNGPSEIAAMLSKDIQFAYIGHGAHSLAIQGKVNVLIPNGLGKSEQIIVGKWANVNDVAGLKGKTVGTQLGTSGDIVLDIALRKAGITKSDVNVVNMDVSGIVSSMVGKKVDAVSVWAPYTFEISKQLGDEVFVIASITNYLDEAVFPSSWIVTPEYQKDNPDIVNRFTRAILKAMDYRSANMEDAIEIVAKLNGTPIDSVALEEETAIWLTSDDVKKAYSDGEALKWYEAQQKIFINSGVVTDEVDVNNYVQIKYMNDNVLK
ncbi:ABC transporter substrate-binding protein [Brachyspira innocens]|uniref:ABC transporter substrate-binding protein n=1 Tax=Brachyspira innocens TaxID=13264 RepID=A0ABT8YX29_9SPIR|nr:ABC transporter substrate-binding protein [Brachyspira innocens]MDO6994522.1 ABC transporter substrate-binding protein [Brachyspira innocens]MDO7020413.1 ABC transporter substrate-binding protein [Brachyspira innocens]